MKAKKIPYYLVLFLLTLGASGIIGFLSFTGMFAWLPILSLAYISFGLSVAYEGEIFRQNIKGAINKLFKPNYVKNQLANDYLLMMFKKGVINIKDKDCPQFFKDYVVQLKLLHKFSHKTLDKESEIKKRQIEKTLKDMEKWFSIQLYADSAEDNLSDYEIQLRTWLAAHKQEKRKALYENRVYDYRLVLGFSILAGIFMGLGNTYLLMGAFTTAALSVSPGIIIPMSIIAGAAYMFLIYNAVTDMIHNNTLRNWYNKIRKYMREGLTPRTAFIAIAAIVLFTLAILLTLCTAGTWWTIIKETPPLFNWMSKMPNLIMGFLNPLIVGGAQLIFNLQNTSETLELVDEATKVEGGFFSKIGEGIATAFNDWWDNENWLQKCNPFRLILRVLITPLRLILFLGHLASIGVTSDQVPEIPAVATALLGFVCEFGEDFHYFAGDLLHAEHVHGHDPKDLLKERFKGHGHDHSADIPSRILNFIAWPLYGIAACWDYLAIWSHSSEKLSYEGLEKSWKKLRGISDKKSIKINPEKAPSEDWQLRQTLYRIDKHLEIQLNDAKVGSAVAMQKISELQTLRQDLRQYKGASAEKIKDRINQELEKTVYDEHRFFKLGKTATKDFLENLPGRISSPAA